MNIRLLGVSVVVLVVIAGLVAGIFAGSIERALVAPAKGSLTTGPARVVPSGPAQTAPTAPATTSTTGQALAMDNFNRPDQPLWGMSSDNRMWGGDANTKNQIFSIVGKAGQIAHSQGQNTFNALLGPNLGPNKDNVQVLLQGSINHFAAGGQSNIGAVLRWSDNDNWYKAFLDGANLTILKRVNGNQIKLETVPFNAQGNTMYSLRFQAVGATLYAKAWQGNMPEPGSWMLTATDPDLTSGQPGVRVLVQNDSVIKITLFQVKTASTAM
jgi:hypothetical protein